MFVIKHWERFTTQIDLFVRPPLINQNPCFRFEIIPKVTTDAMDWNISHDIHTLKAISTMTWWRSHDGDDRVFLYLGYYKNKELRRYRVELREVGKVHPITIDQQKFIHSVQKGLLTQFRYD